MRSETRLDCATFQLDEARTRCELWVTAGSETEKLASGFLKPFLAHLKEAQDQIARGQSSIKLQIPGGRALWFTKGTIERFVRFVTTPDVLERVSIVETERRQLEEAINILAAGAGENQSRQTTGGAFAVEEEEASEADAAEDQSKNQLLVAMDARRIMLQKEQVNAFTRAAAAGFDMGCMADMVDFADCFGAGRLREACLKFASIYKKMQDKGQLTELEGYVSPDTSGKCSETLGDNATQNNCKIWVTEEKAVTTDKLGPKATTEATTHASQLLETPPPSSFVSPAKPAGRDFRTIPDSPPNFADADSPSVEEANSPQDTPTSRRLPRRVSSPRRRSCSPMRRVQIARSGSRRPGMVVIRNINYASPGLQELKNDAASFNDSTEESDSIVESEDPKEELSRRLSVQDAISLFERKQKDSLEVQSAKADARRASMDTGSSSKTVLRRWSGIGEKSSPAESESSGKAAETSLQTDQVNTASLAQAGKQQQQQQQQPQISLASGREELTSTSKIEERRKSWLSAQNDLEWKFQQLKLQEAALPAVRSSRDTVRSPLKQQGGPSVQFGFQYRGQKSSRAAVSRSWSASSEKDLISAIRQAELQEEDSNTQVMQRPKDDQGRFYEQYRERRDAKIRQESDMKRAERESKLKAMQEILDRRKAELAASSVRPADKQVKAPVVKKGPPVGGVANNRRSPTVTSTTSRAPKQQLTPEPKSNVARKLSPGAQKPPSSRTLTSSPKIPRTTAPVPQVRPASMSSNPLSRSMPSLSELRKENTRPVRSSQQSKVTPTKNPKPGGNAIRHKAVSKVLPLEPNGVVPSEVQVPKDNGKRKPPTVTAADEYQSFMPPHKSTKDIQAQVHPSPRASAQETKPFLRKGRGIGPGAGPGVVKLKATAKTETEEEKAPSEDNLNELDGLPPPLVHSERELEISSPPMEFVGEVQPPGSVRESQDMDIDSGSESESEQNAAVLLTTTPETLAPTPVDSQVQSLLHEESKWSERKQQIPTHASPSKLTLMQQLASEEYLGSLSPAQSLGASLASIGSSSPCSSASGVPQPRHHHSDLDGKVEKTQRRKWGSSQKPIALVGQQGSSKEAPKGLKRLLKFGRKSRSENTEWVSASTTSEGEDTDESRDTGTSNGSSHFRRSIEAEVGSYNGSRSFFSRTFRSKSNESKTRV